MMMPTTTLPKKRIAFIDAMRGFTMLLVVYSHIQVHCYDIPSLEFDSSSFNFNSIFVEFRMPLFFFISGWVLYKKSRIWDIKTSLSFLRKKFKVQILSTLVFFLLFIYLFDLDIHDSLDSFKAGYWFTYTLFFYFLFYVLSVYISQFFSNKKTEDVIVVLGALAVLLFYLLTTYDHHQQRVRIYKIVGVYQWRFYIYFCFGTLVKKYYDSFVRMTEKSWIMTLVVGSFFLFNIFQSSIPLPHINLFLYFTYGFLGIVIIFTVFRKSGGWFAESHRISRWMQYIGRHTLDIYLLHYFFLPKNLTFVGDYFKAHPDYTIELFVSLVLSLMVIAVCLLTSKVICTSPWLGEFLFGKKADNAIVK